MSDFSKPTTSKAYAAMVGSGPLQPHTITRRACHPNDVVIGIKYAGICHSDIHQVREEWGAATFPMYCFFDFRFVDNFIRVPGHEIGGIVLAVGANVKSFAVGETVGVGCLVDSCRAGDEQYCGNGFVGTYNSRQKHPHCVEYTPEGGNITYGGYAQTIVVDANFVVHIPANLDLARATPLLCAGITTYSPLMYYGLRPNQTFAVNGLGGLGHMGVKFGVAFGAHTTVISRGKGKKDSALHELHAHAFLDSTDKSEMSAAKGTFDFILDTVSAEHDIMALMALLKTNGKIVMLGVPPEGLKIHASPFIMGRKLLAGSVIGGIRETQEMLNFCGRHNITCEIEMINADRINEAYERTLKANVKYRFVIDTASL